MKSQSPDFPDSFYRVTVKGFCVEEGKLLLTRETENHSGEKWELPGGGLDFGENTADCLRREVQEEMGLSIRSISKTPVYVWSSDRMYKRRGMEWFYSFIVGYQVVFEHLNFVASDECEEVRFFSKDELKGVALGGQLTRLPEIFNPEDFKNIL